MLGWAPYGYAMIETVNAYRGPPMTLGNAAAAHVWLIVGASTAAIVASSIQAR